MKSPFARELEPYKDNLHPALVEQYLISTDDSAQIILGGKMDVIWHKPPWLYPVFWLLSRAKLFFPEVGEDIPCTLTITPQIDSQGRSVQVWERKFHFPNKVKRYYSSVIFFDENQGMIVEEQGPKNILCEYAKIVVTAPTKIEFITIESHLKIGRFRIKIPRKLWITAHVVQEAHAGDDNSSEVELTITHGILGPIFGYRGSFKTVKKPLSGN